MNARGQVIGVVPYVSTRETATASPLVALRPLLDKVQTSVPVVFAQRPRTKTTKPFVVDGQFRAAVKAFRPKEWAKAEHKLKGVARRFSDSPLVFMMLGISQIQRHEIKKAVASLDKALNMSADSALAWLVKGICLTVDPKRMSQGLESVRRSIELGLPEEIELSAGESLAKTEAALGNTNNAAQALDQVTRLNPSRGLKLSKELIGVALGSDLGPDLP